jgi:hypothetical protein
VISSHPLFSPRRTTVPKKGIKEDGPKNTNFDTKVTKKEAQKV